MRHGQSTRLPSGWFDRATIERWLEQYEDAGLADGEQPTAAARALADCAGVIVASDMRRAVESSVLLAAGRHVVQSPLLREASLRIPALGPVRLPMLGWAVVTGAQWWRDRTRDRPESPSPARTRAAEASRWLASLAESDGSVLAVTHSAFRRYLADALVADGWVPAPEKRPGQMWSAWEFVRRAQ